MRRHRRLLALAFACALLGASCASDVPAPTDPALSPALRDVDPTTSPAATPSVQATPTPPPTRTPAAATRVDAIGDLDCPTSAPDYSNQTFTDERFSEDLTCASFAGALLDGVSFAATSLNGADFRGATLLDVEFDSVTTRGADFSNAVLDASAFEEVDLTGALFSEAIVSNTSFEATICPNGAPSGGNPGFCADLDPASD